jgi:SAM-dependent methyltransferase
MPRHFSNLILIFILCMASSPLVFGDDKHDSLCVLSLKNVIKSTLTDDLRTFLVGSQKNNDLTESDVRDLKKSFNDPLTADGSYLLYMQFLEKAGFDPIAYRDKVVIDLGSGLSNFTDYLAANGVASLGVDFIYHPHYLKAVQTNFRRVFVKHFEDTNPETNPGANDYKIDFLRRIAGSLTNLPFYDNSVDAIVSRYTFIYLHGRPLIRATKEMLRVLKPGGIAFLFVHEHLGTERLLDDLGVKHTREDSGEGVHWIKIYKPPKDNPTSAIGRQIVDKFYGLNVIKSRPLTSGLGT